MQVQQMCVHFNRQCFKVTPPTPTKSDWMHFVWNSDKFLFCCLHFTHLFFFEASFIVGRGNDPMKITAGYFVNSIKHLRWIFFWDYIIFKIEHMFRQICWKWYVHPEYLMLFTMSIFITKKYETLVFCWNFSHDNN